MANKIDKNSIIISGETIKKEGIVILPLREYEKLCQRATPVYVYYLKDKEARELDNLVKKSLRDLEKGKCKSIKSLADFLKITL
jgi:hypothetical protein